MWPFLILTILIAVVDRISKILIFHNFSPGSSFPVIRGVLYITPTYNQGIAFGLFKEWAPFILITLSIITASFILYILLVKRPKPLFLRAGLSLVLAGAVGNLFDRIRYGYVLDFIDIRVWPIFNIADSSVTIGAGLILWYLFIARR